MEDKIDGRLVYLCLEMLRSDVRNGKTDDGLRLSRDKGNFYINDVFWNSEEYVRMSWSSMGNHLRLVSEEPGIDVLPLYDTVIIRPFEVKAFIKTSVLQLPEGTLGKTKELSMYFREMPLQGLVVAVGPGWMTESGVMRVPDVNIGDHVAVRNALMVADFLYRGILYYDCKASSFVARYPLSYTDSLKGLVFDNVKK